MAQFGNHARAVTGTNPRLCCFGACLRTPLSAHSTKTDEMRFRQVTELLNFELVWSSTQVLRNKDEHAKASKHGKQKYTECACVY